jgi:hypothetical protein
MEWRRSLSENRWLLILGAAALLWANVPYLVGYAVQDSQHLFSGFFIFEQDGFSYLAKMRQGAQGNWLFRLPYTTETHEGVLLFILYLVAGKLSRVVGLSSVAFYHLVRLLGSVLLLLTGARFVSRFADSRRWRLLSWVLILFGGGVDWLISMTDARYVSYTSVAPDAFVYSILFGPPHVMIALALLLWTLLRTSDLFRRGTKISGPRAVLSVAAGGLGVALSRPEYVPILLAVTAVYWLALCWKDRRPHPLELCSAAGAQLPALLYGSYVYFVSRTNPAIAAWTAQNPFESPSLPNLLAGLGLLFVPATLGVADWPAASAMPRRTWWRNRDRLLLTSWLLLLPILLYLPLSLNRRLVGGAQFSMAIVAGYWIDHNLMPWLSTLPWKRLAAAPILALATAGLTSYPILFGLSAASFVSTRPDSLFISPDELAALEWLGDQDGQPIVLADERAGNHIPAFSDAIPVLGHPIETLAVARKRSDIERFYSAGTSTADREALLELYGVDLVWWGPIEQAANGSEQIGENIIFEQGAIKLSTTPRGRYSSFGTW